MCLAPVAFCLDKLQGETDMYLGDVLPWLSGLKHNLGRVEFDSSNKESLKCCKALKDGLKKSFDQRFSHLMKLQDEAMDHIIASVCHPKWRLRWLSENLPETTNSVKQMVLCALKEMAREDDRSSLVAKPASVEIDNPEENNFFNFMKSAEVLTDNESHSIESELLQYLSDTDHALRILHKYPRVRSLFLKYNAGILSSAPVERLFSFAGLILVPRRSTLKDKMFEMCTWMKANAHIN